jgi:hypothetical protein
MNDCASMVVAVPGTTISPYLFFWQAAQEVEDNARRPGAAQLRRHPEYGPGTCRASSRTPPSAWSSPA